MPARCPGNANVNLEKMNSPKVSIILPTYNVEKFLRQCLESIAAQTYKNIEVIIIIDGATDKSFEIAQNFCEKDNRFNVYWQKNAGSGPARNNGLDRATGQFIMFVDPDDWCLPDYVENMLKLQRDGNYDIVTTSETTIYFSKSGKVKKTLPPHFKEASYRGVRQMHEKYLSLFLDGNIHAPHCKIYKTDIIKDNGIRFPDLRRSQDIVFNYRYYDHAQSILISNYSGYMYRVLSKERAKRLKPDYYKTIGLIYNEIKALHDKWGIAFDKEIASTFLFGSVYTLFESNSMRGEPIRYIVNDPTIKEIIERSEPQKKHLAMVRSLVLNGNYALATLIVKIVFYIKMILQ